MTTASISSNDLERLTTSDSPEPLNREMIAIAHALAKAHGHNWGRLTLPEGREPMSAREIAVALIQRKYQEDTDWEQWLGIAAPTVRDGSICHTTGSGRLTWVIDADYTVLKISRPRETGRQAPDPVFGVGSVPELVAEVVLAAKIDHADRSVLVTQHGAFPLFARHLHCLSEAVIVVVGALEGYDVDCPQCREGGTDASVDHHGHRTLAAVKNARRDVAPVPVSALGPYWAERVARVFGMRAVTYRALPSLYATILLYDEQDQHIGTLSPEGQWLA